MGAGRYGDIKLVEFGPLECAIEIGAERGEGSTQWLHDYCEALSVPFFSVDIEPNLPHLTIKAEGEKWLSQEFYKKGLKIKYAYLDNYDYVFPGIENEPWLWEQKQHYLDVHGITMTNAASKQTHAVQAMLVDLYAVPGTLIIIDDTWDDGGEPNGKGGKAVPLLLGTLGYHLVEPIGADPYHSAAILRKGQQV